MAHLRLAAFRLNLAEKRLAGLGGVGAKTDIKIDYWKDNQLGTEVDGGDVADIDLGGSLYPPRAATIV
jgi:hypothetical protein